VFIVSVFEKSGIEGNLLSWAAAVLIVSVFVKSENCFNLLR